MRRLLWLVVACGGCSLNSGGTAGAPSSLDEDTGVASTDSSTAVDSAPGTEAEAPDSADAVDTGVADTTVVDTKPAADTAMPDTTVVDTAPPPDAAMPDTTVVDTTPPPDTAPADMGTTCVETGAVVYGGHCYFPIGAGSWTSRRDACVAAGAHLVSITSSGEQTAVGAIGTGERWVGLQRTGSAWGWVTAESATYTHWRMGEPNGSGTCGRMDSADEWRDTGCDESHAAICERDSL